MGLTGFPARQVAPAAGGMDQLPRLDHFAWDDDTAGAIATHTDLVMRHDRVRERLGARFACGARQAAGVLTLRRGPRASRESPDLFRTRHGQRLRSTLWHGASRQACDTWRGGQPAALRAGRNHSHLEGTLVPGREVEL